MITMARIQGSSMGFPSFQKPILQTPRLGGIFDFLDIPPEPKLPPFDFSPSPVPPFDAGFPVGGGADGGGAPAPAPPAGPEAPAPGFEPMPPGFYPQQPRYLYPVQEVPAPTPTPAAASAGAQPAGIPTWAIVGGSVIAGVAIAALLLK